MSVTGAALTAFDIVFEVTVGGGHCAHVVHCGIGQQRTAQVGVHDDPGSIDEGLKFIAAGGMQDGLHLCQCGGRANGHSGKGSLIRGLQNTAPCGVQGLADGLRDGVPREPVLPVLRLRGAQEVIDRRQLAQVREMYFALGLGRHAADPVSASQWYGRGRHCIALQGGTPAARGYPKWS